jgi:predicted regulator of Ras-like GTPase activity (Roadblock/LC7/MglB family)
MADDIRVWSDELARDPSSLVFLPLAETLRKQGQIDTARKVAMRGVQRHPQNADAHDLMARIYVDSGDLPSAHGEWERVLQLVPGHAGASKGIAFILFQQGKLQEAEQLLMKAHARGADPSIAAAINTVRRSSGMPAIPLDTTEMTVLPSDPRDLFTDLLPADQAAIMLDKDGLVLAGSYRGTDGKDVAEDVGATLSGLSGEALRTTKHLSIGAWKSILFETEGAIVSIAPAPVEGSVAEGGLLVLAAPAMTPLGQLTRGIEKCRNRAFAWLKDKAGVP